MSRDVLRLQRLMLRHPFRTNDLIETLTCFDVFERFTFIVGRGAMAILDTYLEKKKEL